ncbi:hypothetical protein JD844_023833 [Phrynosoma platyrhinos]|uniref:Peptidase M12B domain-containing protein n=1 Tax=Phrynosoma platyrhinos TaxID=52577 RepID=A0ABQ7SX77_PHRPL|nr:hypothetical protein JD844_023833 [Phrynosoma platyrhinos]
MLQLMNTSNFTVVPFPPSGESNSKVIAHIGDEDVILRINTNGEEYNIEVYPVSRVFTRRVCMHALNVPRQKRAVPDPLKNTCKMLVVADHRFFKHMGRSEESTTINYLIELIDRVDDIYRNTSWDNANFKGYGIQIDQIIVHSEPQAVLPGQKHYNMEKSQPYEDKDAWEVKQLLEQFSIDIAEKAAKVCLAHLFTYQDFDMGTLGLAYVGSQRPNSHGGICPKAYSNSATGKDIYLNSGLTSTKNYGKTILTKEADLVTTHELGHNFGAEHDPDGMPECAPTEDQGGKYVMYPIAVSGDHENNKVHRLALNRKGTRPDDDTGGPDREFLPTRWKLEVLLCYMNKNNAVYFISETDDSCKVCCRDEYGRCSPYLDANQNFLYLRKGKPCTVGFCDMNGKCEKRVQDVIERLWDFIDQLSINTFGKFLADNIVGSVLVFSLLFWIPLSILVHCMDQKLDRQYEENTKSLFGPSNAEMLSSMDSASVRIIKPNPAVPSTSRHQPLQPVAPAPVITVAPKLDHQRMDTIQEDPSTDSHIEEDDPFEKDPFPNNSTTAKSYEDLTDHPVTRSEKASSFKLQRQHRVDSKETEC